MKKVFILGNPRSGTSLLRIMLNCHPKIAAPPECGFMQWWYKKYKNWTEMSFINNDLTNFLNDFFSSRKIDTWELSRKKLREFLLNERPSSYEKLTECIYEFWAIQNDKNVEILVDKNNYYINHLPEISKIWPDAYYILLVRDGRDVACSYKRLQELETTSRYKPNLPTDTRDIAKEWKKNHMRIINFLEGIDTNRFVNIKYEKLILDNYKTLSSICHFLGIKFNSKMSNYYVENKKNKMEPKETLDWKKKTLKKLDKNNIGNYKEQLDLEEVNTFNRIAGDMLKRFKYSI